MLAAVSKPSDSVPSPPGGGRPRAIEAPTSGVRVPPLNRREGRADPLAALVAQAQRGEAEGLRQVLRALAPKLLGAVRAVLGASSPDVEDVLQESLMAVTAALRSFRGDSTVLHYACRITARTAIAARKRQRGREALTDDDATDADRAADGPSPADDALASRRRQLLRALLDDLNEDQAETLTLRVVMGMSLEEVAASTGVPVNTVRSRVRLAKEALRRRIEEDPRALDLLGEPQ